MPPRRYSVLRDGQSQGQQGFCWSYQGEDPDLTDVVNDDVLLMSLQYSTQWDSLAHVGALFEQYNRLSSTFTTHDKRFS